MPTSTDLIRLFNVALDMFCIVGYDGYFKQVSPAWERALGYTDAELLAKPYVEFIHPDDRAPTVSAAVQISQGIQIINFQNRYMAKNGTYHWLSWNSAPYPDEQLIYAVARDVTDIKLREARQAAAYTVTRVLATARDLPIAAPEILRVVCERLDWEVGAFWYVDQETQVIRCLDLWHPPLIEVPTFGKMTRQSAFPIGVGLPGRVWKTNQPHWVSDVVLDSNFPRSKAAQEEGLHGAFAFPIRSTGNVVGVMEFFHRQVLQPDYETLELFDTIGSQIGQFIERRKAELEREDAQRETKYIRAQKDRLAEEKLYLEEEIRNEYFDDIVGDSPQLRHVLEQINTVAETTATVLILGETGTGKELIARALHNRSQRRSRTFVKLNCSAIPTGLLESELFGHERGAFTGAIAQKLGRLEVADKGTLFLDEIGDIPLELQPKLLRALQESEFERLGSTRTLKVDVRLIAATNRDLQHMVQTKEFRSDLYYRLNVFPIKVPPLRDRPEDIPRLVRHFVSKYALRMNRDIDSIPESTMTALYHWSWPGNVRELENFIERAVILTRGSVLNAPIAALRATEPKQAVAVKLEDSEREHILKILRETAGVLSGPAGAAERLGLKRTTLQGKMKKLGIQRSDWLPSA